MIYLLTFTLLYAAAAVAFSYGDYKKGKMAKRAFLVIAVLHSVIIVAVVVGIFMIIK